MNYKHSCIALSLLAVSSLAFISCEDTLTENPDSYYTRKDFFTNPSNAEMAINGIYNTLAALYGYNDGQNSAASDDILYPTGGSGKDNTRRDMGHYAITTSNKTLEALWNGKYEQLNRANYCIQNIVEMQGYQTNERLKELVGQAKVLRAQASLDLIRYWGDVPYKTTYSSSYEDAYQPRTDREKIYDQVIQDLNEAKQVLPWADESSSPEKITQGTARGLLMRALLARAGYSLHMDGKLERPEEALRQEYFKAVIDEWDAFRKNGYHGFYDGGYEALFKGFSEGVLNSKESLFEVAFYYPVNQGYWGTYMGPSVVAPNVSTGELSKYMGRANASFRAIPEWRGFFEANADGSAIDKRRDIAICTYAYSWDNKTMSHVKKEDKTGRNWYPGKWRREWTPAGSTKNLNCTDINYCMLRYADVVLMAAEAYNETGNTTEAWALLDKVRERAGATQVNSLAGYRKAQPTLYDLPFFNSGSAQDDFRTALYWERGFELAFEGQRKYDLIRWGVLADAVKLFGKDSAANAGKNPAYLAGENFVFGKHELFPIPLDEMQVNYKLNHQNNPGY